MRLSRGGLALVFVVRRTRRTRLIGDIAGLARQDEIRRQWYELLGGNAGSDDVVAGRGAQEVLLLTIGEHPGDRVEPGAQQVGQVLDEQGQGHVKGVTARLRSDMQAQGLHQLRKPQDDRNLLQDEGTLTAPPVPQAEELFDRQEGQFNVEASGVQPGDIAHRQLEGVEHIGEVQAQVVEERETEVAQVAEQQAVLWQVCHERERLEFAVAQGVGHVLDAQPALRTDVKEGGEFAGQERRVADPMLTLPGQVAYDRIQFGLIQSEDVAGKGSQRTGRRGKPGLQPGSQLGKQGLQRRVARLLQALHERAVAQAHRGKAPQGVGGQETGQGAVAVNPFQDSPQQAQPQMGRLQRDGAASACLAFRGGLGQLPCGGGQHG